MRGRVEHQYQNGQRIAIICVVILCSLLIPHSAAVLVEESNVIFHNQVTDNHNSRIIGAKCDFLNDGELIQLDQRQTTVVIRRNPAGHDQWLCCQFHNLHEGMYADLYSENFHQPDQSLHDGPFDAFMGVALLEGTGAANRTDIYLRNSGIYVENDGSKIEILLAAWESGGYRNYTVCPDPKFKSLKTRDGSFCAGECTRTSGKSSKSWCLTDTESARNWARCTPRSDFNIINYAENNITSYHGFPCKTKCSQANSPDGLTHKCRVGLQNVSQLGTVTEEYCSPQPGYDYQGFECDGDCWYHGYRYKWCNRVGGSWGYCSK